MHVKKEIIYKHENIKKMLKDGMTKKEIQKILRKEGLFFFDIKMPKKKIPKKKQR
jgi:hypothetical protein